MSDTQQPIDTLIHIADLHFWEVVTNPFCLMNKRFWGNLTVILRRRHHFVMDRAEPFADTVAATGVKDVLLTGDFASTATHAEFQRAREFVKNLAARGLSVTLMPGNHDVYTYRAKNQGRFEEHLGEFLPDRGHPGPVTLPGGTPVVVVPTVCPRHFSARGYVSQEVVIAVGQRIEACPGPLIVAAHYPVLHKTRGYESKRFRRLENAEALREVLGASDKRILYVAGHVHRASYERDPDYPNIEYLTTDAFFRADPETGARGQFTEIHVLPDGFRLLRHVCKDTWTAVDAKTEFR